MTLRPCSGPDPDGPDGDAVAAMEREITANVGQQLAAHCGDVLARFRLAPDPGLAYVSPSVFDLVGYTPEDLYADPRLTAEPVHPDDVARLPDLSGGPAVAELRLRHRDGHWLWTEVRVVPVGNGGPVLAVDAVVTDISDRKAHQEALATRALHDPLTRLANRSLLLDRLDGAMARARRSGLTVAVMLIDVDRFKLVNDTYGHRAGDQLLTTLAGRLQAAVRASDTVGRIGGDEFVVVCDALASPDDALEMSQRVRFSLSRPVPVEDGELQVSVSIGLAMGGPEASAEQLLGEADAAMYRAKEQGRNRAEVFDEAIRHRSRRRLALEGALRHALDREELAVHFQPVVSIGDGRVVECEALARWQLDGTAVPPSEFVPVAEDAGLIGALGRLVLRSACRQAAAWPAPGNVAVSVNLSPRQLAQRDLRSVVEAVLEETGLSPDRLCFEITESAMVDDLESARSTLGALHSLGVRLSLDDFGTGYSSLLHLRRLPFHQVKVDRTFVTGLGREPSDTAIVAGVVGLGHALGMTVVAEGVETETQLAELAALGCELGQGYHWCPPLPTGEVEPWIVAQQTRSGTAPAPGAGSGDRGSATAVLVVDDSTDMRQLMRFAIEVPGSQLRVVGEAGDGTEAVAAAARLKPDVILLDLVMPDRGGLEVLPELLAVSPGSRVIVLSGFVSPSIERAALAAGASAYLTKGSVPIASLVRRVREMATSVRTIDISAHGPVGR